MERRRVTVLSDAMSAADIRASSGAGCKVTVEEKNTLMCKLSYLVYPFTLNYTYMCTYSLQRRAINWGDCERCLYQAVVYVSIYTL